MQCVELQLCAWVPCLVPAQRHCWEADATLVLICKILWEVADMPGQDFLPVLRAWAPVTRYYECLISQWLSPSAKILGKGGREDTGVTMPQHCIP